MMSTATTYDVTSDSGTDYKSFNIRTLRYCDKVLEVMSKIWN